MILMKWLLQNALNHLQQLSKYVYELLCQIKYALTVTPAYLLPN